jgi:hypothetical protein
MLQNFEQDITGYLAARMGSADTEERLRSDVVCRYYKYHEKLRDSILEEVSSQCVVVSLAYAFSHIQDFSRCASSYK